MTGVAKGTVLKLLVELGAACRSYQDAALRNLKCRRIQCDEIWSFVGMKQKTAARQGRAGVGDVWTWTALDADTKLVPSFAVGKRDSGMAYSFIQDLADRLSSRIQLTTDGHKVYVEAVEAAFGADIDYSMLIKLYGAERPGEARYSPAKCIGTVKECCNGQSRPQARQHVLRRAPEPHDADVHAALHPPDQRLL
jgi:IS1 family transposase